MKLERVDYNRSEKGKSDLALELSRQDGLQPVTLLGRFCTKQRTPIICSSRKDLYEEAQQ